MSVYFQKTYQRAFGTFPLRGDDLRRAALSAAKAGWRAFDTAQWYGNEADLGVALRDSGLPRDDLCITTKVRPDYLSEDRFLPSVERSLKDLQVERVDVLLLHWPPADGNVGLPLELLQRAYDRGMAASVGVSNYTARMMRVARAALDAPIAANQVEFHPLLNQEKLLAAAAETGIPLTSYCSVARGEVLRRPVLVEVGEAHGKSAAQAALRWILQKGVGITVMSTNPANIRANFDIMDFTLSPAEMARVDTLTAENHRIVGKAAVHFAPEFD